MVSATPRYTPPHGATHIIGIDISNRIRQLNHGSVLTKGISCTNSSPFEAIFVYFSLCHRPKMHLIRSVREAENTSPWPKLGQRLIRRKTGSSKCLSKRANRELKQRRFWATHFNRKWGLFHFKSPWRYQKCLYYYHNYAIIETICPIIWAKPPSKNEKRQLLVDAKELECLWNARTRIESRNRSSTTKRWSEFHTE